MMLGMVVFAVAEDDGGLCGRWQRALTKRDDARKSRKSSAWSRVDLTPGQDEITADMTTRFEARKQKLLEQLDAPDGEYHDLSPKGSVDAPIRDLIGEINGLDGLVTTSSCSGRISVFLEGRKANTETTETASEHEELRAGPGGKGGGGAWLFISHTPVDTTTEHKFLSEFGLQNSAAVDKVPAVSCRYIHLKFEPMVSSVITLYDSL
jgi:tRNA wybutosine-synthesizing protein 3